MQKIIFFDGICNLCNGSVQFVIKHDPDEKFLFASFQSDSGRNVAAMFGIDADKTDSFVLISEGKKYFKSTAALMVIAELSGPVRLLSIFRFLPESWRNRIYDWVAKNRYQWFGKKDSCMVPTENLQKRFL
jgi:predicted DCC family thiol-disulfide oxidoreductase YuxK